jgi:phage terminase large subunit
MAIQHDEKNVSDCAKQPHELTHNCDALRYFAQLRTLSPETVDDDEEEYYDSRTSYEDAMCGGDAGAGYLMCG